MDLKDFLAKVLPAHGTEYYGAVTTTAGSLTTTKLKDLEALSKYITSNNRKDTFFATGSFNGSRKAVDAELRKCFFVDLDIGDDDPTKYSDKKEAAAALLKFCSDFFLPPSLVLDSGGGLHAYWTLTTEITATRWKRLADAFKKLHEETGLRADHACTADLARVLRAPFSINFKYDAPLPVRIVGENDDVTIADVEAKLNEPKVVLNLAKVLAVGEEDLTGGQDYTNTSYHAKDLVKNCPMFRDAFETGGAGLPESTWQNQVHVLVFCEDGDEYVHEISKGYEGYSESETQLKWNQKLGKKDTVGPVRCDTFSRSNSQCATCPHFGKITTPLQVAEDDNGGMPWPFKQDDKGVYRLVQLKDIEGGLTTERINVCDFKVESLFMSHDGGEHTVVQFDAVYTPNGLGRRVVPIQFNAEDMYGKNAIAPVLAKKGVILSATGEREFGGLIISWSQQIANRGETRVHTHHFGWLKNNTEFSLTDTVIRVDGEVANANNRNKNLSDMYKPTGEAEPWLDIAQYITAQGRHEIDVLVLTAFAGPLMALIGDHSAILSFVSSKSGTGKSTAMQVAQAVWGHPVESMVQLNDTNNSMLKKMGFLRNLPMYWDEIRPSKDVPGFIDLIYQLTLGKEKSRLTSTSEMQEVMTWKTMMSLASNESIAGFASYGAQGTEAIRMRVFEFEVPDIEKVDNSVSIKLLKLLSNHGVIGRQFATYLVENKAEVQSILEKIHAKYTDTIIKDPSERFWVASVAALVTAAVLANKLGFLKIDVPSLQNWLALKLKEQREDTEVQFTPVDIKATDRVAEFLNKKRGCVFSYDHLITKHTKSRGVGKITVEPRDYHELAAAIAVQDNKVRLNKALFTQWCYENNYGTVKDVLKGKKSVETRGMIDPNHTGPRPRTIDVSL